MATQSMSLDTSVFLSDYFFQVRHRIEHSMAIPDSLHGWISVGSYTVMACLIYTLIGVPYGQRSGFFLQGNRAGAEAEGNPWYKRAIRLRQIVWAVFMPAFVEELFWRAMLLPRKEDLIHAPVQGFVVVVVTSVIYVLSHYPMGWLLAQLPGSMNRPGAKETFEHPDFMLLAFLLSINLVFLFYFTDCCIWPCVFVHWLAVVLWQHVYGGNALLMGELKPGENARQVPEIPAARSSSKEAPDGQEIPATRNGSKEAPDGQAEQYRIVRDKTEKFLAGDAQELSLEQLPWGIYLYLMLAGHGMLRRPTQSSAEPGNCCEAGLTRVSFGWMLICVIFLLYRSLDQLWNLIPHHDHPGRVLLMSLSHISMIACIMCSWRHAGRNGFKQRLVDVLKCLSASKGTSNGQGQSLLCCEDAEVPEHNEEDYGEGMRFVTELRSQEIFASKMSQCLGYRELAIGTALSVLLAVSVLLIHPNHPETVWFMHDHDEVIRIPVMIGYMAATLCTAASLTPLAVEIRASTLQIHSYQRKLMDEAIHADVQNLTISGLRSHYARLDMKLREMSRESFELFVAVHAFFVLINAAAVFSMWRKDGQHLDGASILLCLAVAVVWVLLIWAHANVTQCATEETQRLVVHALESLPDPTELGSRLPSVARPEEPGSRPPSVAGPETPGSTPHRPREISHVSVYSTLSTGSRGPGVVEDRLTNLLIFMKQHETGWHVRTVLIRMSYLVGLASTLFGNLLARVVLTHIQVIFPELSSHATTTTTTLVLTT